DPVLRKPLAQANAQARSASPGAAQRAVRPQREFAAARLRGGPRNPARSDNRPRQPPAVGRLGAQRRPGRPESSGAGRGTGRGGACLVPLSVASLDCRGDGCHAVPACSTAATAVRTEWQLTPAGNGRRYRLGLVLVSTFFALILFARRRPARLRCTSFIE